MTDLVQQVNEAFIEYGTAAKCQGKINVALKNEKRYVEEGVYVPVIDLTTFEDSNISTTVDDGDLSDDKEVLDYACDDDSDEDVD